MGSQCFVQRVCRSSRGFSSSQAASLSVSIVFFFFHHFPYCCKKNFTLQDVGFFQNKRCHWLITWWGLYFKILTTYFFCALSFCLYKFQPVNISNSGFLTALNIWTNEQGFHWHTVCQCWTQRINTLVQCCSDEWKCFYFL